jgi:hypothetical protein
MLSVALLAWHAPSALHLAARTRNTDELFAQPCSATHECIYPGAQRTMFAQREGIAIPLAEDGDAQQDELGFRNPCQHNSSIYLVGDLTHLEVADWIADLELTPSDFDRTKIAGQLFDSNRMGQMTPASLQNADHDIHTIKHSTYILQQWGKRSEGLALQQAKLQAADFKQACSKEPGSSPSRCLECICQHGFKLYANDQLGMRCTSAETFTQLENEEWELSKYFDECIEPPDKSISKAFGSDLEKKCSERVRAMVRKYFPRPSTPLIARHCNEPLPPIHGFYHITALGPYLDWQPIVADQLESLKGLLNEGANITVGINAEEQDAEHIKRMLSVHDGMRVGYANHNRKDWPERMEVPTLTMLQQFCRAPEHHEHLVFYMHSKGVSKVGNKSQWRLVFFWRKYLEYYALEHPEYCIEALRTGQASSCGVDLTGGHFSGNFWWATCKYINSIPITPCEREKGYTCGEMWIGSGDSFRSNGLQAGPKTMWKNKHSLYSYRTNRGNYVIRESTATSRQSQPTCQSHLLKQGHVRKHSRLWKKCLALPPWERAPSNKYCTAAGWAEDFKSF